MRSHGRPRRRHASAPRCASLLPRQVWVCRRERERNCGYIYLRRRRRALHVPRLGRARGAAPARTRDEHDADLRARDGCYTACAWRERWRACKRRGPSRRHHFGLFCLFCLSFFCFWRSFGVLRVRVGTPLRARLRCAGVSNGTSAAPLRRAFEDAERSCTPKRSAPPQQSHFDTPGRQAVHKQRRSEVPVWQLSAQGAWVFSGLTGTPGCASFTSDCP